MSFIQVITICNLVGEYNGIDFYFCGQMYSNELINNTVTRNIEDSKYYFKKDKYILMGHAAKEGNDDLLIFYDMENEIVFIYDQDKKERISTTYKLIDIIMNLKAFI